MVNQFKKQIVLAFEPCQIITLLMLHVYSFRDQGLHVNLTLLLMCTWYLENSVEKHKYMDIFFIINLFADVNTYLALQLYYNIIIISLQSMQTRHLQRYSHLTKIANYVLTASLTTLQTLFSEHNLLLPSFLKRSSTSCIHLYLYIRGFSQASHNVL